VKKNSEPQISPIPQSPDRDPRTYAMIGAAMEVHRTLGPGFLEAVYQEALEAEFLARGIPSVRESDIPIIYKGKVLKTHYRPDFVCYEEVIVELKAISSTSEIEEAQIINYLKASGLPVGLLLNFGTPSLQYRRYAFTQSPKSV
jgi:GxxExxY protein